MICKEHYNRVIEYALSLQLVDNRADSLVYDFDAALIGIPIAFYQRVFWVVC
jgi:hypothetical protein